MSDGIRLSEDLITEILTSIAKHDDEAKTDRLIALQYLSAVSGFLAADYPGPDSERNELLQHLHEFSHHVCAERRKGMQQQSAQQPANDNAAKGKSVPTDDPAVGIWKPEQD